MEKPVALIVEDDRDIVALFRHVLDIAGYHTEIVLNGIEAMERVETLLPNIVLLDLQLPGMSGVEILKRMRSDARMSGIPVVVITAYAPYADSLPVEPDLLLLKPVDINQLSNLVQRLQATQGAMHEPSHDTVTGLYTFAFFTVRLAFSLERVKQTGLRRFGVLFADVAQFLTLVEEIPNPEAPLRIASRVRDGMKKFIEDGDQGLGLRVNLGVLLCDSEYEDIHHILRDIQRARTLLQDRQYTSPAIFDREMLAKR